MELVAVHKTSLILRQILDAAKVVPGGRYLDRFVGELVAVHKTSLILRQILDAAKVSPGGRYLGRFGGRGSRTC